MKTYVRFIQEIIDHEKINSDFYNHGYATMVTLGIWNKHTSKLIGVCFAIKESRVSYVETIRQV